MPRNKRFWIFIVLTLFSVSGCAVTKDIKVRAYKQDKKRLDQIVEGTVGNWEHSPQAEVYQEKDTRKVYFVEFSKEPQTAPNLNYLDEDVKVDELNRQPNQRSYQDAPRVQSPPKRRASNNFAKTRTAEQDRSIKSPQLNIPTIDDMYDEGEVSEVGQRYVDYKVEKNDTLQKISKKFYNSYSKWPRIYEANKGVLKTPDILKPGIVLKIPVK